EAFAAAVIDLLGSPQRRAALAAAARDLALAEHDWRHVTPKLLDLYDRLTPARMQPVSVIATVLNERDSISPLVDSLGAQSRPPDEVVVVDGGSTDGTREALEAYQPSADEPSGSLGDPSHRPLVVSSARGTSEQGALAPSLHTVQMPAPRTSPPARPRSLRVLSAPGANISQGRNRAIGAAAHDLIASTDAGVVLGQEWLARLVAPLERDPRLQVTSGFFVAAPQSRWELALGATTLPAVEEIDPAHVLPSSRSVAFRRDAWQRAGGYPEWLDYCEDLVFDFALRRGSGPLRFVPRATVRFRPRPSIGSFFRQYYRYARGDGKADLWRKRHAIRYAAYLAGICLLWRGACGHGGRPQRPAALLALGLGGVAFLRRPLIRLVQQSESVIEFCLAAPLVPVARVTGDVAKMVGYPAGLWWRLCHLCRRRSGSACSADA
ncbi:MAG: glycosyltransferase, partial [Chloroflexota bacterium]